MPFLYPIPSKKEESMQNKKRCPLLVAVWQHLTCSKKTERRCTYPHRIHKPKRNKNPLLIFSNYRQRFEFLLQLFVILTIEPALGTCPTLPGAQWKTLFLRAPLPSMAKPNRGPPYSSRNHLRQKITYRIAEKYVLLSQRQAINQEQDSQLFHPAW